MTNDWKNCVKNVEESAKVAGKVGAVAGGAAGAYASVKLAPAIMLSRAWAITSGVYLGASYGLSDAPSGTIDVAPINLGKLTSPSRADIANGLFGVASGGVAGYAFPKATNVAGLVIGGAQYGSLGASFLVKKAGMLYCDSRYEKLAEENPQKMLEEGQLIELPAGGLVLSNDGILRSYCDAEASKADADYNKKCSIVPPPATPAASAPARAASGVKTK
jgi:hypothetical protein